jgi:DNA primase
MIPNHIIEEIRNRSDIVEVISSYLPLKKRGNNYIACCPFHQEKTPSFTVSAVKQMYHCFGCGVSGDAVKFIMDHTGLDFVSALERLASICGVTIQYIKPQNSDADKVNTSKNNELLKNKPSLNKIMMDITSIYQQNLSTNLAVNEYVKKRKISKESIEKFNIGYATNIPLTQLKNIVAGIDDLITLGMLVTDHEHDRSYNRFNERLIFPIKNIKGEVIAFGGRTLNPKIEPKYLNSSNTVLFDKSKELYGLYQSLKTIKEKGSVIVVEGYMDVVTMHQFGFTNAVASMGTSITELQIKKLFRYTDNIYFMFDGDKAGKKAAWRALEISLPLVQDHKQIHFVFLPDGDDPDSILKNKGSDLTSKIIERDVVSMGEFLIRYLSLQIPDLKKDSGKSRLISLLRPYYAQLQGIATKALLVQHIAEVIKLEPYMIEQILLTQNKSTRGFYGKYGKISKLAQPIVNLPKNNLMLRRVLRSLLLNPKIARSINLTIEVESLMNMQRAILNLLDYLSVDCDSFEDIELSVLESIFINVDFDIIDMYKQLQNDLLTDKDNTLLNVYSLQIQDELQFLIKG